MKFLLLYTAILVMAFSCKTKSKTVDSTPGANKDTALRIKSVPFGFTFYITSDSMVPPDKKLADAWKAFVQAVQADDLSLVEKLSTDCIACENCQTEADHHLPFKNFLRSYYQFRFNTNLKSRMSDSSKVDAHYESGNRHIYSRPCISSSNRNGVLKIVEFFIITIDKSEMHPEGGVTALAFIETSAGYKFCGYSTVP